MVKWSYQSMINEIQSSKVPYKSSRVEGGGTLTMTFYDLLYDLLSPPKTSMTFHEQMSIVQDLV